jgi:hypothetical protein
MKKFNLEIKRDIEITEENLTSILACALEGGSNYWYFIGDMDESLFERGVPLVDNIVKSLFEIEGYKVPFYDGAEEYEFEDMEYLGDLTLESIKEGIQLMAKDYAHLFNEFIEGDEDANTGDVWLQLCVMKDVVYC